MANHKSALKRINQTEARTEINRTHRTKLRHQIRKLRAAIESKDKPAAQELLGATLALIDHSIHKGILHANAAARSKSRLTVHVNEMAAKA